MVYAAVCVAGASAAAVTAAAVGENGEATGTVGAAADGVAGRRGVLRGFVALPMRRQFSS